MGITVTFESFEEMQAFAARVAGMEAKEKKAAPVKVERTASKEPVVKEETPEEVPEVAAKEEPVASKDVAEYKLEDVRAKLTELSKAGKRTQVKELLESFGSEKLKEIPAEKYGELMEKAGEL